MATKISQLPQMTTPEDVMQVPYITSGSSSVQTKRMAGSLLKSTIATNINNFVYDGGNATSTFVDPGTFTDIGGLGATG